MATVMPPPTRTYHIPVSEAVTTQQIVRTTEAERRLRVSEIGFWAAILTAAGALGWVVAVTLASGFNFPAGQGGLITQFVPSLFLALAYVVLMVAIQHYTPAERQIWASIAVPIAAMYAVLNATVYFVELTLVIPHQLNGGLGDLAPFVMQSGHYLFAVDVFGYTLMSLAAAFAAFAFSGSGSSLERWIRGLLLVNWPFAAIGPLVMMFTSQGVSLMILWALVWTMIIPVPAILLTVLFRRDRRRELA